MESRQLQYQKATQRLADRAAHAQLTEEVMQVKRIADEKNKSIAILRSSGDELKEKISVLSAPSTDGRSDRRTAGDGDQRILVDLRIPSSSAKKNLPGPSGDGDQRIPVDLRIPISSAKKNLPVTPAQDPKSSWRARS